MKTRILAIFAILIALMTSCTKLNKGDSFTQTVSGIEFRFEVLVSKMTYVRVTPVQGSSVVRGEISIPAAVDYDGTKYTVTQVGQRAFMDYTGITEVTLPKTLSIIEEEAFAGCTALHTINTPQPLSEIHDRAFDGCVSLEAFSLKASISKLGEAAFRDCRSLKALDFQPQFTEIPASLCEGCTSLGKIILPATIMNIGADAFRGCLAVLSIEMDSSVQTIGSRAFAGCSSVTSISITTPTPPTCMADTFEGIRKDIPVTVPQAHVADYSKATGWNWFDNIVGKY